MATIMATISPNEDPPEKQRYGHDIKNYSISVNDGKILNK